MSERKPYTTPFTLCEKLKIFFERRFYYSGHPWDAYSDCPDLSSIDYWAGIRLGQFKLGLEWFLRIKGQCNCRRCKEERVWEEANVKRYEETE